MLARSSLVVLVLLPAGCLKDLTQIETGTGGLTETTISTASSTATTGDEPVCGNGKLEPGEQCDDGNTVDGDSCAADCTKSVPPDCGDGVLGANEECDDGNNLDGDGCKANCLIPCGDNIVDPNEECDDGNGINTDSCKNDCTLPMVSPSCGDGKLDDSEECDLGEDNDNNGTCTEQCTNATCGDGYTQGEETCDDGNKNDSDMCTSACQAARCGDGFVQAGETCDNGDEANNDTTYNGCTTQCEKGPRCGDGELQESDEECDDGTPAGDDLCNACAEVPHRYVFVTSQPYPGDLNKLAGADIKCSFAADNANIPGSANWTAWLSDNLQAAATRMDTDFEGWYILPGQPPVLVARNWSGLSSGTLLNPINRDESGSSIAPTAATWTNTAVDGTILSLANHCGNWDSSGGMGNIGLPNAVNETWTNASMTANCDSMQHLYCVQK